MGLHYMDESGRLRLPDMIIDMRCIYITKSIFAIKEKFPAVLIYTHACLQLHRMPPDEGRSTAASYSCVKCQLYRNAAYSFSIFIILPLDNSTSHLLTDLDGWWQGVHSTRYKLDMQKQLNLYSRCMALLIAYLPSPIGSRLSVSYFCSHNSYRLRVVIAFWI
jgi:hypothetical protein